MKAKKLLSLLLALIMCAGLVPAQVLAAGNMTLMINTEGIENGTVEIVSIPDGATQEGNKVSGLTAKTGFVTVKATPKEGYEFLNWTVKISTNGTKWLSTAKPNSGYVLKSGQTFASNPIEIANGTMAKFLQLTPNFGIPLKLAVESSDPEMGEVVLGPNTGKQLTEKTEKGYVGSYNAGNVEIGYRLKDSEKYQFVGWTIRYTNGESGITEDLDAYHYMDLSMRPTTTWPYDQNPWSKDDTVVGNTVRDLISYNRKGIKHDITITAVFNDKTSPNYTLADDNWKIGMTVRPQNGNQSIYSANVTGWDNTTNEVVAEFNGAVTAAELKDANTYFISMPIGMDGGTIRTASGLTVEFTDEKPGYTYGVGDIQGLSPDTYHVGNFADVYEIHFNVLDNNGNTKPGVIRLNLKNRGRLTAEHGAVQYLGKQYENGSVIDFVPDGDGDATMTAVPEEGYKLLKWIINGAEYPANGNDITFAVPESTFDIQAVFAAPEFVVAGKTPRFDIRDNLLELTPFVTLATEGTVTGWSNDTDEQVVVTFNNVGTLPQYVAAYYRLNKDSYAPDGTSLSFGGRETGEKGSWLSWSRYYYTQLNADDYEIPFTITDKNGFVKRGVIRFERDGKAGIEAEHGSVIYNDTEYTNGQTIDVAAGEITLQAKADEGYAFAGWEIGGKEYSDNPLTIEADGKFFIIKAKFAKLVTVSTGEGIVSEGAARFADDETAESKTVAAGESVSITNVPGKKSKFVAWHVEYEKAEGKFMPAEEGRHYTLGEGASYTDGTITIVTKEYNIKVYPEFERTYSITLQQAEGGKASFAEPVSAIGKDAVSGLTKDSAAVTWEREVETGYRFDKWGIEYFDTAKNEWVADPTGGGSTAIYRYWTPVNGDGRMRPSMSVKVTEYDLRITPQFSKGLTVEAVADPAAGGTAEVTGDTDGYFYKNQYAKLKAAAADGYNFGGWTIEYKQEDGIYAPAVAGTHYRAIIGSADTAEITAAVLDHSLRFTAKFTKQLYVELAQGEHGTAEFVGVTPDANNRVYGPDDSTGNIVATVKATPEEGYAFGGWTILNADTGKKAVGLMGGQYGNYFLEDGESEASNPLRIGFSKHSSANFHVNLKLVPVFGKEMKVTVASDNSEYGTVTPEGENIVSSVGGKLDFGAKPAEDCLFMGWEITYADGTEIPEKEKDNLFSFNTNSTDNDATGDNNQLTIFSCEKDLKLTAHFVKKGEPNFVRYNSHKSDRGSMQAPRVTVFAPNMTLPSSYTGWSNDVSEPIVIVFDAPAMQSKSGLRLFYRYKSTDLTAAGVTFNLGEGTVHDASRDTTKYYVYNITAEEAATLYELPFTATDANGNVKNGVIRFAPARRALIEAENGAVSYNDATYAAGSIIDFPAGEATITAAANEGYAFAGWEIEGVELSEEQAKSETITFNVPEKFFTIKARFEVENKVNVTLSVNEATYGTLTSESNLTGLKKGDKVELIAARNPNGYEDFLLWHISGKEGTDYTIDNDPEVPGKATLTVLGTKDVSVMAVFRGKVVGLQPSGRKYAIMPVKHGQRLIITYLGHQDVKVGVTEVTGWNNNPNETLAVTITLNGFNDGGSLVVLKKYMGMMRDNAPDILAPGASYVFPDMEDTAGPVTSIGAMYLHFTNGWDRTKTYHFSIVDESGNVLKNGTVEFRAKGLAKIEAENGAVEFDSTKYNNGEKVYLGTDSATITAAANEGYAFAGWEIEGVELSEEQAKSETLTFTVPEKFFTIKAKFEVAAKQLYVELAQGEHGTAEFVGVTPDADNRVYGPDDSTGNIVATVKATPEEGYAFGGWTILNADTGKKAVGLMGKKYINYVLADGESAASNPLNIGFSNNSNANFHINLKLVPVFNEAKEIIIVSDNPEYGTVTPDGSTQISLGGSLAITAKPAEGCMFMGWEVVYADGSSFSSDKDRGNVYGLKTSLNNTAGETNTIKLYNGEKVLKVIGHFVKTGDPNFVVYNWNGIKGIMGLPDFAFRQNPPIASNSIVGWNNNTDEEIVVTFNTAAVEGSMGIGTTYSNGSVLQVAPGVKFDFGEGTYTMAGPNVVYMKEITEEEAATLYELPFTATDANGNVKKGVIRFTPARRALIEAENGAVSYNDATYAAGSIIDFPAGEATITAAANEGYAFAGWEIEGVELSEEQAKSETLTFTVPEKFFTIKAKFEADTTPGIKVTVKSENTAKGSAAATTDGLDNFKPNGTSIIELSATPAANCTLVGWTVTDTASGEYLDKSLYTLYEEGENKLLLAKGVDKDVTVTAYFANSTEGVFVMPGERLPAFTITGKDGTVYTGAIENWDNNTYNEIVVTFSGFGTSDILGQDMLITLSNGSSDVLAPTDLVMKRTDAGNGKEEVVRHENGGKVYYSLSGYQRESRIPFTFTDRNGNVKKGTIKLNLDYRAEVYIVGFCQPSGDRLGGYVLYNGNKYYSGDVIPFEPDAEGYVTITAVPEEKFANIEYVFKNWKMDTVELTADEVYANPLKFKPSKEYCVIQPQFAGDGRLVVVTDAENGRAEFKKNGELVEGGEADGIAYGTDKLSVEAIPDDGYVFVRWQVEKNYSIIDQDSWVGEKFTEEEQARLLALVTSLSENDIREAKLDFTLEDGLYALRLTPLFGLDAKGATITLDNSESEKGTISSEDDLTDVRWYLPAVTIKAEKKDGYEFQGWTVTSTATGKRLYNGKDYEMVEVDEYTMTIRPLRTSTQDMTVKGIFPEYQPVHGTVKGHGYAVVYEGKEYREGDVITFPNGKGIATLEWKPDNANAHFVYWFFSDYVMNNESEARRQPRIDVQLLERDFEINVTMGYQVNYRIMCDGKDITRSDDWASAGTANIYALQGLYGYNRSKYPTIDDAIDNYSEIAKAASRSYVIPGDGVIFWLNENFRLGGAINGRIKYVYDSITVEPAAEEIGVTKELIDKQYGAYEDKSDEYRVWAAYVMPESDITIVINVRRIGYSQITAQPNNTAYGSVTMSPESTGGDGYYREGIYLRINAAAKSGYRFVKWEEAQGSSYLSEEQKLSSSLNLRVGVDSAALTAVFEEDTNPVAQALNLVVDPAGKANVLVNGAKGVTGAFEGESVTVSLGDVDDYYAFDHWEITRDSSGESLITSAASYSESLTFVMPNGSVTVKAVLNAKSVNVAWRFMIKKGENTYVGSSATTPYMADISIWKNGVYQDPNSKITVVKGDTISFEVKLKDPNKYILEKIWLDLSGTTAKNYYDYKGEYTLTSWKHNGKAIYQFLINVGFDMNDGDIQRYNLNVVQPASGGTIECSSVYPLADSVVKLTAKPEENYRLKRWIVTDEYNNAVDVAVDDSDANSAKFTMPAADVTVTAEFEQTDVRGAEMLAVDILSGKGGAVIASGTLAGDAWTVDLSGVIDKATADGIPQGTSGLYMRITANEGTTVEQVNAFTGDWSNGDIACYMPLNQGVIFIAHNGEQSRNYTITLAYSEPGAPELSNGSAERISDKEANIKFTSSEGGSCYYVVVESGAAEPAIDTEGRGMSISAGENTLMLTNLAKGARDIYIVVKNASGVASKPMKIEIPAFSSGEDDGEYTISVAEHVGGTLTPSRTRANEGDEVTISISAADGMQMKVGSLTYTEAIENGKTVTIENGKFTMPACDVTISCQWESTASQPTGGGITGFVIDGIPGTIDASGNIVVTMPYKTDVTALRPVITGVNIAKMTPASSEAVDFTKPVIYTVTLTDGTVKLYTVTVQLHNAGAANELWDKLTDPSQTLPWWKYAEQQRNSGYYPRYW